jgi:ferredoxin-NADP reductase
MSAAATWPIFQSNARHSKRATSPIHYIAGPSGMVKGLHEMLNGSGVDDDDIRTEEFTGY